MSEEIHFPSAGSHDTFIEFTLLVSPDFRDKKGIMTAAFDAIEELKENGNKPNLIAALNRLLDGSLTEAQLEELVAGREMGFRFVGENLYHQYFEACRIYTETGSEESIDPLWRRGGLMD